MMKETSVNILYLHVKENVLQKLLYKFKLVINELHLL